jgi:ADP-L-glycero-D-manno-heptose 6-epimerase
MIVVTGASGFIGSNVVAALNRRGCSAVVAVDEYPELRSCDTGPAMPGMRYLADRQLVGALDLHNLPGWLQRRGQEVDAVIHLGACSDTTATDRDYVMSRNFEFTRVLWQWCTDHACPLIYASSAATYGDGARGYDDRADPRDYRPLNLYGESKQRFDLWALAQPNGPPRWAGLKYFNVYGPHESHKGRMASVVFHAFHQIRSTGHVRLFRSHRTGIPDGGQRRDFVYVADAVDATLHLLDTPASTAAPNGLYNVGTGQARTFQDLACAVFTALGQEPRILYVPMPEDLRDRYQYWTQATVSKLVRAGFGRSFCTIEEGACHYVRGHLLPTANQILGAPRSGNAAA